MRLLSIVVVGIAVAANAGLLNIIYCPDCGKDVSVRAAWCPHCGCTGAAIAQAARVSENAAKLPPGTERAILGDAGMGQLGRIMFIRTKNLACDVVTNGVDSFSWPSAEAKKKAEQSCKTIVALEKLEFTFDQIYTMRMDLVQSLQSAKRKGEPEGGKAPSRPSVRGLASQSGK